MLRTKWLLPIAALAISAAGPEKVRTVRDALVCPAVTDLMQVNSFSKAGDRDGALAYIAANGCEIVRAGSSFELVRKWDMGVVQIRFIAGKEPYVIRMIDLVGSE